MLHDGLAGGQPVATKGYFGFRISLSYTIPAHDRPGLALSGRYARQFGPRLLIGYSQLTYKCAPTRTHTYIHIHRSFGYPPSADAPHCRCQLPAQTLKLRNRQSSLKLRIFQQPGYQDQVVVPTHYIIDPLYVQPTILSTHYISYQQY